MNISIAEEIKQQQYEEFRQQIVEVLQDPDLTLEMAKWCFGQSFRKQNRVFLQISYLLFWAYIDRKTNFSDSLSGSLLLMVMRWIDWCVRIISPETSRSLVKQSQNEG